MFIGWMAAAQAELRSMKFLQEWRTALNLKALVPYLLFPQVKRASDVVQTRSKVAYLGRQHSNARTPDAAQRRMDQGNRFRRRQRQRHSRRRRTGDGRPAGRSRSQRQRPV